MTEKKPFQFYLYNKPTLIIIDWYNIWNKNRDIDLELLFNYLKSCKEVFEIRFYNGIIENKEWSLEIIKKAENLGYKVVSKKAKYLDVEIDDNNTIIQKIKCDFDAEIAMDIILNINKFDNLILFSGDGDFAPIVKYLLDNKKRVFTIYSGRTFGRFDYQEFEILNREGFLSLSINKIKNNFVITSG